MFGTLTDPPGAIREMSQMTDSTTDAERLGLISALAEAGMELE